MTCHVCFTCVKLGDGRESLFRNTKENISTPIAYSHIENVNVEEDARGQGVGNQLMDRFFEEAWNAEAILLIADSGEEQLSGFELVRWYEGYDFEVIGMSGDGPVMVRMM